MLVLSPEDFQKSLPETRPLSPVQLVPPESDQSSAEFLNTLLMNTLPMNTLPMKPGT